MEWNILSWTFIFGLMKAFNLSCFNSRITSWVTRLKHVCLWIWHSRLSFLVPNSSLLLNMNLSSSKGILSDHFTFSKRSQQCCLFIRFQLSLQEHPNRGRKKYFMEENSRMWFVSWTCQLILWAFNHANNIKLSFTMGKVAKCSLR